MSADHPRLTPARPDLAHEKLRGQVTADRFAAPRRMQVTRPSAPLMRRPGGPAGLDTELLMGEAFDVLESADGWAWGQSALDGYVGYVPADALGPAHGAPTHRVRVRQTHVYPGPDIKLVPMAALSLGARVTVTGTAEAAGSSAGAAALAEGGHAIAAHLAPVDAAEPDWVAVAEQFVGTPYLWGGRTGFGLDCSALVQLARQAAGFACLRDTDMLAADLGRPLDGSEPLRRGDLVFWRGHVGVMLDDERLLHANAFHMATAIEPLAETTRRIDAAGGGPVTRRARLDDDGAHR